MDNNTRGYKPHLVRDILGLTIERFRYWRAKLDPKPHRSHFTYSDILVYRVMKTLIRDKREQVEFLSKFDWSELFTSLNMTNNQELKKMVITLHLESSQMNIQYLEEIADNKSNKIIIVYLEELIQDQLDAFLELGDQNNIVAMSRFQKNS